MEFKRLLNQGENTIPTIEVDKWQPHPEKKGMVRHVGMRTYGEVFRELKEHLSEMGMLPDEYFISAYELYNHADKDMLPDYSEAVCYVNFGGNEGIYLDVNLANYVDGQTKWTRFATGKTLDCDVEAFYRMSMICAECSLMLNGRGHFIRLGERNLNIKVVCEEKEPELTDSERNLTSLDVLLPEAKERSQNSTVKSAAEAEKELFTELDNDM